MEYVPGGDFRTLLNNSGVLKEEHARFYISEMFIGVNELHKLGYIHRDLKPEVRPFILLSLFFAPCFPSASTFHILIYVLQNFLVDSQGHVKLTDFGLATGSLNPQRIEALKGKLERVKNNEPVRHALSISLV